MHPEITAMVAAEHVKDMRAETADRIRSSRQARPGRSRSTAARPRSQLRIQTGWALVWLGLRIASPGGR